MSKPYKTTKADFKLFSNEVKKWIKIFGLNNWELYLKHGGTNEVAACYYNLRGKVATIKLGKIWDVPPERGEVCLTGFHEACELLLCPLSNMAEVATAKSLVESANHDIINTLQNVLYLKGRL
jgi:hypothetical protein